ncbi:hypothetical protein FSP39_011604 [Pinctada imbricata]|uniref:Uncharacterized protein n=1 Tax=Pinctada imbricata TaxID=66713 RepID=A0AA88Y913_PINIB|nr:hypothetical protein FSP39_011604 [Pinctada imbricata]
MSEKLEGKITYSEALVALKGLKNVKSPGMDGYNSEFFKFFWQDIGIFWLRFGVKLACVGVAWVVTKEDLKMFSSGQQSEYLRDEMMKKMPQELKDAQGYMRSFISSLNPVQIITNSRKEGSVIYSAVQSGKEFIYVDVKGFLDSINMPKE